jgi:hypothetical protein
MMALNVFLWCENDRILVRADPLGMKVSRHAEQVRRSRRGTLRRRDVEESGGQSPALVRDDRGFLRGASDAAPLRNRPMLSKSWTTTAR